MSSCMALILFELDYLPKEISIELICRFIEVLKDRIEGQLLLVFYFLAQLIQYLIYIFLDVPWLPPSMK